MLSTPITPATRPDPSSSTRASDQLEQAFLEEMLKYAGPKPSYDGFGGGAGEDQFSSFLTREYAAILSQDLDFGLRVEGAGTE